MDDATTRPGSGLAPSARWSVYAGVYAFICGSVMLLVLGPVSETLVTLLALPTDYAAFLLAVPVGGIAAVVWWAVVERRRGYGYRFGVVFGLLTALLAVGFWVLALALVWGAPTVLTGGVVVAFVFAASLPVALVTGLSLMYARRRRDEGSAGRNPPDRCRPVFEPAAAGVRPVRPAVQNTGSRPRGRAR